MPDIGELDRIHAIVCDAALQKRIGSEAKRHNFRRCRLLQGCGKRRICREHKKVAVGAARARGVGHILITIGQTSLRWRAGDLSGERIERQTCRKAAEKVTTGRITRGKVRRGHLVIHRPAFTADDDPIGRQNRQRKRLGRAGAVKRDRGFIQRAHDTHRAIDDLQFPIAVRALAPKMSRHEGPFEVFAHVIEARARQPRRDTAGRGQPPLQLTDIAMRGLHFHRHMLQPQIVGQRHREGARGARGIRIWNGLRERGLRDLMLLERRDRRPRHRHVHRRLRIHPPCSVEVAEMKSGTIGDPTAVKRIILRRGAHQNLLHIAISQRRIRLQHQRDDTGHGGRGG